MSITNKMALAHVEAFNSQGTVAQLVRDAVSNKKWDQVGDAYGQLLEEFGKRSRIKGTKDFTPSTPADTFNTQIQTVTKDMECGKLKPVLVELDDGSEIWGLEPVQSRTGSKRTLKKLEDIREQHVTIFEGRTMDEKAAEVAAFAEAMGVQLHMAEVVQLSRKDAGAEEKPATKGKKKNAA